MRANRGRGRQRRGAAAVEAAIVLPLLLLIILPGVWEIGRATEVQQVMNAAVREGGREASTGQIPNSQIITNVKNYVKNAGISSTNVTVTVTNLTAGGDATSSSQLDRIQVSATIPYQDVRWTNMSVVMNSGSTLSASSIWYSMKDKAYPAPAPPPIE